MKNKKIKTATLLFALCGLSAQQANAQYRQYLYPSTSSAPNTYVLSSVDLGSLHSAGNHIIGTSATAPAGSSIYNFELRATDGYGNYAASGPWDFFNSFHVYLGTSGCNSTPALLTDTYGMSVIETGNPGPYGSAQDPFYAVVAAVGDANQVGCVFTLLHSEGAPIGVLDRFVYYKFPAGATAPSKPYIAESSQAGNYYICGAYSLNGQDETYVIKVSGNSSGISHFPTWSRTYVSGTRLRPAGIMESPHNSNDVVLIGENIQNNPRREDGFFMKLNAANGNLITFKVYGNTNSAYNTFTSFAPAFSNTLQRPAGYVIGGKTIGTGFESWMLKVDQNGVIAWNRLLQSTATTNQEISGVLERTSVNNGYEYFGVTSTGTGNMTVFKLDNGGSPNFTGTGTNEFEYNVTGGGPAYITCLNSGSTYGDGINVFGCDLSTNQVYAVKAYFSGESGCGSNEVLGSGTLDMSGPNSILAPLCSVNAGLSDYGVCSDLGITTVQRVFANPMAYQANQFCPNSSPAGSNARTAATGIGNISLSEAGFQVFPNPATDNVSVSYNVSTPASVKIDLFNYMGQHVKSIKAMNAEAGSYKEEISLSSLNLAGGVYFIKAEIGSRSYTQKVVYTK